MTSPGANDFRIQRYDDPAAFLRRAGAWLMRAEAEHNLALGIAQQLAEGRHGYDAPIYLATVEDRSGLRGCAFRTPPYPFGVTGMPDAAVPGLVRAAAAVYERLPAVLGPEPAANTFAEAWAAAHAASVRLHMRQRIFRLDRVQPLSRPAAGRLRAATPDDQTLVSSWIRAFHQDTRLPRDDPDRRARSLIAEGRPFLWEDGGEPRSMAVRVADTPNGARIGPVYTPPPFRGRGYASACTAALSRRILASGKRFCVLFTDLANPTSNAIYSRIGYRPVSDTALYSFEDSPSAAGG